MSESELHVRYMRRRVAHCLVAAQAIRASRRTADGDTRIYLLAGLVRCGACGRRMDAHWVHGRPGYRCRHGHTSSRSPSTSRMRGFYVREDHVLVNLLARVVNVLTVENGV